MGEIPTKKSCSYSNSSQIFINQPLAKLGCKKWEEPDLNFRPSSLPSTQDWTIVCQTAQPQRPVWQSDIWCGRHGSMDVVGVDVPVWQLYYTKKRFAVFNLYKMCFYTIIFGFKFVKRIHNDPIKGWILDFWQHKLAFFCSKFFTGTSKLVYFRLIGWLLYLSKIMQISKSMTVQICNSHRGA